jgi:hypothetical protein
MLARGCRAAIVRIGVRPANTRLIAAPFVTGNDTFEERSAGVKAPRGQGPTTHDAHIDNRKDSARTGRKKTAGDEVGQQKPPYVTRTLAFGLVPSKG